MIKSLYVHIPFCDKICTYCDFSKLLSDTFDHDIYLEALFKEYTLYKEKLDFTSFETIYFGGGTPSSLVEENLEKLLSFFAPILCRAKEITFEANPESLTTSKIKLLKKYGVNRVSMGVQTFNAKQLRFLGRHHTMEQVAKVVEDLNAVGIVNYSFDLIYALPRQDFEMFQNDVQQLLKFKPAHVSSYALIVEERTKLSLDIDNGKYQEVDEALQFKMYEYLQETLEKNGYIQYEVSNWAKDFEHASHHNMTYWTMESYLGIGLGSHGFVDAIRYANTKSITRYVKRLSENDLPLVYKHDVSRREAMEEMIFLGLRRNNGVNIHDFSEKFSIDIYSIFGETIKKHQQSGKLLVDEISIRLSPDAIFTSNEILSDFLLDEDME